MDVVLVGLPGSGKTAVGRRLATREHATFVDLDADIEALARRTIPEIFAAETESGFRRREREAIEALGSAGGDDGVTRVIATGGGAVVDPRNRWRLYRNRRAYWLDAPAERLALRVRAGGRPLLEGRDPVARLRELRDERLRFYAAAERVDGDGAAYHVLERLDSLISQPVREGTRLLLAETPLGRIDLGYEHAGRALLEALRMLDARRVAIVTEPMAWKRHGSRIASTLKSAGLDVDTFRLPRGESAKSLSTLERLLRQMARKRLERRDPLIAIGGGAIGDAAGFAAAVYLRGVPLVHLPTTLLAQIDAAIGGKTAVDLPEGKNLVGAFYQPRAVIVDVSVLGTLPPRQRRAALGEAVKYAALGDARLLELLETEGPALADVSASAIESGALAELVERCAWRKVEIASADEREEGERIVLNLGHSIGHAIEAAARYDGVMHGEAVAHGLRGAIAIGRAMHITPEDRASRIERLIDLLGLTDGPLRVTESAVRSHLLADKKHDRGELRWILPDANAATVRTGVPESALKLGLAAALRGGARHAGRR